MFRPLRLASIIALGFAAFTVTLAPLGDHPARADEVPASPTLPDQLSLDEALKLFRQRGLDLLIADAQVKSAEADVTIAGAIPNPNAQVGGYLSVFNAGLFQSPVGFFVGVGDSNAIEDTLSGKRGLRRDVARAALAAAKMSRADAERTLSFQVKQQYFQAVLARALLDFAKEVALSATQTAELNQIRYKAGAINEADLAKVETAKLEADQAVESAEQSLRLAKLGLAFLLGVRALVPDFQIEPDLIRFAVPQGLSTASRDSLIAAARDHRPDLQALGLQQRRAEKSIALARRLRFPDLSLNLQFSMEGTPSGGTSSPTQIVDEKGNPAMAGGHSLFLPATPVTPISPPTFQISIAGTIPAFYLQQGEIQKAEADLRTQVLTRTKVEAQVVSDIEGGWAAYASTRRLVERMEAQLLDRSKKARDLVAIQYQKGSASLLEYLDANRTYIQTNVEYLQDLTNYWTAVFQLEQAVGMDLR